MTGVTSLVESHSSTIADARRNETNWQGAAYPNAALPSALIRRKAQKFARGRARNVRGNNRVVVLDLALQRGHRRAHCCGCGSCQGTRLGCGAGQSRWADAPDKPVLRLGNGQGSGPVDSGRGRVHPDLDRRPL